MLEILSFHATGNLGLNYTSADTARNVCQLSELNINCPNKILLTLGKFTQYFQCRFFRKFITKKAKTCQHQMKQRGNFFENGQRKYLLLRKVSREYCICFCANFRENIVFPKSFCENLCEKRANARGSLKNYLFLKSYIIFAIFFAETLRVAEFFSKM